jgi:hypothetical protein
LSNNPSIVETLPAPPSEAPAPLRPTVQQLTLADLVARIHDVLKDDYALDAEDIGKLEQLQTFDLAGEIWKVGENLPRLDSYILIAIGQGTDNDRIADAMQGDLRMYCVPRTVVPPGAREYRRYTLNQVMPKMSMHGMTLEAFVEAVAYEELTVAVRLGMVDDEDDEEEPETPTAATPVKP